MKEKEYNRDVDAAAAAVALIVLRRSALFRAKELDQKTWLEFLASIFPAVAEVPH